MPNIPILLETKDFVVINKPAGLIVHADGRHPEPSVAEWFLANYPDSADVGEKMTIEHGGETIDILRAGIVHRIDRETSGVLVIAKTQESFESLKEQFKEHTIKKKYAAIVFGWMRDERGIIDKPIGRSGSNIRAWAVESRARGLLRPAITRFSVQKKFIVNDEKYTYVDLFPETGRTHQLRVHLAAFGYPIICDPIYAGNKKTDLPIHRTALHAEKITFNDLEGNLVEVKAPIPDDMKGILDNAK
jgi:23S rRNA pseudouridine1911/1915/1917 synthase